ncbi:glycosyltransferase 87 family protein [Agromyces sp. M3QZ16-3]|uniref:glycosyltransferase 87 family protein n=1 Tax=Agromyces sp. M3QZ16-3 TaxID=3447585 RepID=UPI003F68E111
MAESGTEVAGHRPAAPRRRRPRLGARAALWIAFAAVHLGIALLNLYAPGWPLGDVTAVYRVWAETAQLGFIRMGIDTPWVYPILAFAPMTAALAFGSASYGVTWLGMVTLLDAIAFSVLLGRGTVSRRRRAAAWWWLAFLALLGPIALGRIDAVTVPFALVGLLWAAGRPRVAAVLVTIATWIKVWPAALVAAMLVALRRRFEVFTVAAALSIAIVGVSLLAGSGANAFGFVAEQAGRGLQIEAPLAVIWLWWIVAGTDAATIVYDRDILTFQIEGPGADVAAALTTPLMLIGLAAVLGVGVLAARRGAHVAALLPPLALAFTVVLMIANKVGSPQFVTWLAAPVVLGLVLGGARFTTPAALAAAIAVLTQVIYPYWYGWLLIANPGFVLLLTVKVVLLCVLLGWSMRAVWQAGRDRRHRTAS